LSPRSAFCRKDISAKRVKRWAFSIHELLKDPAGKEHFIKFLGKEFSDENLR
jgi:regulator of G-protein signaling